MKFKINIKPNEIIFLIVVIVFLTFSYVLCTLDNPIFNESAIIKNEVTNVVEYKVIRYHSTYKDEITQRHKDRNENFKERIERTYYSSHSPLYKTFTFTNDLLFGLICVELLLGTILFFFSSEKLSKCNYQLKVVRSIGNINNNNIDNTEEERELKYKLKKKRNVFLGIIVFMFTVLVVISFVYAIWLPLNIRKSFIENQSFDFENDKLCAVDSFSNDTYTPTYFGKCKSLNGHISKVDKNIQAYSWTMKDYNLTVKIIVSSTFIIGALISCLLLLLKLKKDPNQSNNNNNLIVHPKPIPFGDLSIKSSV